MQHGGEDINEDPLLADAITSGDPSSSFISQKRMTYVFLNGRFFVTPPPTANRLQSTANRL